MESTCGRYTVARYGTADGLRYEAWRTPLHPLGRSCLESRLTTAEAAKSRAEADAWQYSVATPA